MHVCIHYDFQNTLVDSAPPYSTAAKWTNEIKSSRESLEDVSATPEIIAKVHKMVLEDHRLNLREISEAVGMSSERAYHISREKLGVKKLSVRWVRL